jgi:hypothetical protein
MLASLAFGQLTQTGIHGFVRDPSGAVVPGAVVKAQDVNTTIVRETQSAADGGFVLPNLTEGTYKVSATAKGFETSVLEAVVVDAGRVTDVSLAMTVGSPTETVMVSGAAAQLETSSNEIGMTVNNTYIQDLPYSSRDSLNFATLAAGFVSADFNNLPNASMNISIDGMDNNSERFKSGGTSFYAFAPERIDAVEQVTVSTTGTGADSAGFGAMNIRFQIKRGTDKYHFTVGEQFANEDLNANSFFGNLRGQPIAKTRQNNPYGSLSGPLLPFLPKWRHKLFFFAYMEAQPQPGSSTLTATVLSPAAQAGNFTYLGTDGAQHTVNLLAVAQAAGFPSTIDPTIQSIFGAMNTSESKASGFLGIPGEYYGQTMEWTQANNTLQLFPAARVDYQITPGVAYHGSWSLRHENISPSAPPYPGLSQYAFTNDYKITTYIATSGIDWTINPHLINNATFGVQSNGEYFYYGSSPAEYAPYGNRMIGMPSSLSGVSGSPTINATIPTADGTPYIRNNPVYQFRDDLTWVKGKHTIVMGGTVKHSSFYETSCANTCGVPYYQIGLPSGDPFASILQNALPAINTSVGDQTVAQNLYAILTGTVSGISGGAGVDASTHQYNNLAYTTQAFAFTYGNLYIQDSFRLTPHLTLNLGFHWEMDGAIHDTNGILGEPTGSNFYGISNGLFQPGVFSSNTSPVYNQTNYPYKADLVLPAPLLGFAWNPSGGDTLFGKLIGDNKTVVRGGGAINYYNEGMNTISNPMIDANGCNNLGAAQSSTSVPGDTGFTTSGVLLSQPSPPLQLFPGSFGYPIPQSEGVFTGGQAICLINPNLKSPYTSNWNLSVQRQLPGKFVLEVDYVGNKSTHTWHYQNQDEVNIFENGFLTQFQQAQTNLAVNQANGKGATFANNGLPGQNPLPIFQTAFGANGGNAALSSSSGFGSSTFITDLNEGLAGTLANSLASTSTSTYYCRLVGSNFSPCSKLGYTASTPYPANFFTPNPYATYLGYQNDNGNNNYNALQVILRKSLSHGFVINGNFTWSHGFGTQLNSSDQTATYQWWTMRNGNLNYGPSPFDRRMVFNAFWTYELPFGKGRMVNINNGIADRVLGGWTLGGIETISTGAPALLSSSRDSYNNLEAGGVEFGSLTANQLRNDLATIPNMDAVTSSGNLKSNVSAIVNSNGSVNPAYYGPNTVAGILGTNVYIYGKNSYTLNMSLNKQVRIHDRLNVGFRLEALNFLNHPFFSSLGSSTSTGTTFGQVSTDTGTRTVLLRAFMSW